MTVLSNARYLCQNISAAIAAWKDFEGYYLGCSVLFLTAGSYFHAFCGFWGIWVFFLFLLALFFINHQFVSFTLTIVF